MKKDSLLVNKIVAAVVAGGLIASVSGFIAHLAYHPKQLEKNAFTIAQGVQTAEASTSSVAQNAADIKGLFASVQASDGQNAAKKCAACHSFDKGGANKVGPNLYAVAGRKLGSVAGFTYSEAMVAKGGVWNSDELNHFLFNPKQAIKGTKMGFAGISDDKERAAVIKYLYSLSDSPTAP